MMTKRKRDMPNQRSITDNTFLAKRYSYESELSLDDIIANLRDLHEPLGGYLNLSDRIVDFYDSPGGAAFIISKRQYARRGLISYTTVRVDGVITEDEERSVRVVQGRAKFGWVLYVLLLTVALVCTCIPLGRNTASSSLICTTIVLIPVSIWLWSSAYQERNTILDRLHLALTVVNRTGKAK